VTTSEATTAAASTTGECPTSGTATFAIPAALSVSNKPVVPTAHHAFNDNSLHPLRRHTGRPLASQRA
jgi:hypothetical protein